MIFSTVAVSILFGVCFRLNIFTNKISNLLLPLAFVGVGAGNLDIPHFSLFLLVAFVLKHNVDKYIYIYIYMRNIDVRIT